MGKIDFDEMPALISASPSKAKTTESPFGSPQKDPERLASETKRLLLRHREHAQTLSELAACFREARDPAHPTVETMYESLCKRTDRFEVYTDTYGLTIILRVVCGFIFVVAIYNRILSLFLVTGIANLVRIAF